MRASGNEIFRAVSKGGSDTNMMSLWMHVYESVFIANVIANWLILFEN